ncbi:MAG: integrase [Hyphomicrobiales bacterium]|nr:MAG: integrase [Hyphomicrobiales bacterium]
MQIRLKGINQVTKTLADGTKRTYYFAWKGGPRLQGEPGSPEFIASYHAAVAAKVAPPQGVIFSIIAAFRASTAFADLADRTRRDYVAKLRLIEKKFGTFPLAALSDRRTRGLFLQWRDELALASRRQADYHLQVFARMLSWALDRGLIPCNPCERAGRTYRATRADKVWTAADEAAFYELAPKHLHLALTLALWTGQRQGDLLALTWGAYDGRHIRLRQGKSGRRVVVPVGAPLKAALDLARAGRQGPVILTNSEGMPWTADGFRSSWRKACAIAGVVGVTFHDLRGTAISRLALAGATEPEIASLTGHTLSDVTSILDRHYLNRDPGLAVSAIRKLEKREGG